MESSIPGDPVNVLPAAAFPALSDALRATVLTWHSQMLTRYASATL